MGLSLESLVYGVVAASTSMAAGLWLASRPRKWLTTQGLAGLMGLGAGYREGSFLWIVNNIFFQYYSALILVVSSATLLAVSALTPAPEPARVSGLTLATVSAKQREDSRATWNRWDVFASLLVLIVIAGAYLYFTG